MLNKHINEAVYAYALKCVFLIGQNLGHVTFKSTTFFEKSSNQIVPHNYANNLSSLYLTKKLKLLQNLRRVFFLN